MGGFYPVHLHYSDLHYSDVDFPNSLQLAVPPGSLALQSPEEECDQQSRARENDGDPDGQLPLHAAILPSAGPAARVRSESASDSGIRAGPRVCPRSWAGAWGPHLPEALLPPLHTGRQEGRSWSFEDLRSQAELEGVRELN